MNVFVSDPGSLRGLQDFLRQAGCIAEECRCDQLDVNVPEARNKRRARQELDVYLARWQMTNPGVETRITDWDRLQPPRG